MCNSIVVHVRVWSGPKLGFGRPGPAGREDRRSRGQRRSPGEGDRQTLPLVFERAQLSVQLLQLSVLLRLKGNHLFDVLLSELMQLLSQLFILEFTLIVVIAAAER